MKRGLVLVGVMLATFLAAIEGTVIGPAGPTIVSELGSVTLLSWIFTSYLLTMAVTTPIFGKLTDLFGRKPIFLIGCSLFVIGSLLCGLAGNMNQLILYRAIQGIGAGAVIPVTFTIIGDMYTIEERGKVQGMISSVWGISSLLGPLLGGYVSSYFGWEWIFGFNVPFGILAMFFIARYLHERVEKRTARIDIPGAVTFTIGMAALLLVLTLGGQYMSWSSPGLLGLAAIAAVFLILFLIIEQRVQEPMVPLKLFGIRDIAVSCIAALLVSSLLIGLTSYLPLWIQGVRGGDAASSGLALSPMAVGWLLGSVWAGRMIIRLGSRFTSVLGLSFITAAAVIMLLISVSSPVWYLLVGTFMYGLGFGFSMTVFTIIAQSSVGFRQRGASTALNTFLRTLGQTIGVAAFGSWLNYRITEQTAASRLLEQGVTQEEINGLLAAHSGQQMSVDTARLLRQVLEGGLHSLFVIMAVIAVLSWIVVWGLRNRPPAPEESGTDPGRQGG
ncbi:MFS transporter [Paenibacillus sp. P96]|uniref:MFS transporter n=1 Tax=Paenibacillus zeirhizosphaerae TaxID=2987519 RepID=A0ABT9FLL3_9BACL|nr:MDR family MFS transporter [Paenibacillus sp. P96]MDP4095608.1 MFS transporter [Paenibacillus sp. P96]